MDSFELNKIIGAILGTLLFVMATGFIAEAIYTPRVTAAQGYDLPEPQPAEAQAAAPAEPTTPLPVLLASASATRGEAQIRKCEACHNITEGGGAKVGPDLYGVVGRQIAHKDDYPYSDALKAHADDTWTYANLDKWIESPSTFAPGTKMTFAGIKDDKDRADLLAYLQTLAHSPVPFPEPEPAGTQGEVKAPDQPAAPAADSVAPAQPASGGGAPADANVSAPQPSTNASPAAGTTTTSEPPSNANPTTQAQPEQPSGGNDSAPSGSMMAPQQMAPQEPAQQGGGAQ